MRHKNYITQCATFLTIIFLVLGLTACGSGGGGNGSVNTTPGKISGQAIKGPISGGTVTAYAVTSGAKGAVLGTAITDSDGKYSISTGSYSGPVFLEITGGSYTDEATGTLVNLPTTPGSGLQAVVDNVLEGSTVHVQITPLTTMAAARAQAVSGGLTAANINAANQQVGDYFGGIDILGVPPINPLVPNSAVGATPVAINYGLILAGFSQEAQTLGLTNPLDLISALVRDFSDGSFDGQSGSSPIQLNGSSMDPATGTANLATAINAFSSDLQQNVSGGSVSPSLITFISNPTPTYTIGGTVTGLTGNGLVLQNNGGDNRAISFNGSFTFSAVLVSGNAYSVTVFAHPTGQTCAVTNGRGTVGSANINNVSVSCVTLGPTIPAAPTGVTATPGDGKVTVSWAPVDGATSYNVYMASQSGVTKNNYNILAGGMLHSNVTSPFVHTGLTNGTTYYFMVTAVHAIGESIESNEVSATPAISVIIPDAPSNLQATAVSSTQINLAWTDNSANEDGLRIERKTGAGGTYNEIATVGANITNYSDSASLVANTIYCYQIRAFNGAGNSGYSNESCTTTPQSGTTPSAPTGVTATPGDGQVTVSWNPVSGATSYNVYMASQSGVTKSNYNTLSDGMLHSDATTPFVDTGLTNGTAYYFVVTAANNNGEGAESTEVTATPIGSGTGNNTSNYTNVDLQGTWEIHTLISGDSPNWLAWGYGTVDIDASGNAVWSSMTRSDGDSTLPGDDIVSISSGGVVLFAGISSFHGTMSQDKNMIIATMDDGGGGYGFVVFQKRSGIYSISDLQGTWDVHLLTSGDSPNWLGWGYGAIGIDASGNAVWSSMTRSDGDSTLPGDDIVSISSGGVVLFAGISSFHGTMSQDKNMIVATMDDGGGGYDLVTFQKRSGIYSISDLQGTWDVHSLTSGDSPNWLGWIHGTVGIDASGNAVWSSVTRSNGDSTLPGDSVATIASTSTVSFGSIPSSHGTMSQDKNMIVATMDDGGGGYDLIVFQKSYSPIGAFSLTGSMGTTRRLHTATLLPSGKVLIVGGVDDASDGIIASAEIYDPTTSSFSPTGSMSTARHKHTATLLTSGKVLIAGGMSSYSGSVEGSAEIYDPTTGTFSPTGSMSTAHQNHTATLLSNGKVLIAGGMSGGSASTAQGSAEIYDPGSNTFSATGSMGTVRVYHTASLLSDGKVLIAGGGLNSGLASVEIYNPTTGTFSPTVSMSTARYHHTATLLPNGKVLIAGGMNNNSGPAQGSAEIYNPTTGTFSPTGSMSTANWNHTATLLSNGKVLIAGGGATYPTDSAELYDPATGTFSRTGSMNTTHTSHTATLLLNGKVLITGGIGNGLNPLAIAELYDQGATIFSPTGSMSTARYGHTATLLPNGNVLIAGGGTGSGALSSAELYDPATGTFSPTDSMTTARGMGHTATLLSNGKVLIAGNDGKGGMSAELYDPATDTFSATGNMSTYRSYHGATLLPSGKVLITGGYSSYTYSTLASVEIYDPTTGTFSPAGSMSTARRRHTATLLPNGKVLIAGGMSSNSGPAQGSAEIYDPVIGAFSPTGSMNVARSLHTAAPLPSGKVLIAGGTTSSYSSAEVYDAASGTFSPTGSMNTVRSLHTATLLPNGNVLVTGGNNGSYLYATAEIYDPTIGAFTRRGGMITARTGHTATLLFNGKVLIVGGSGVGNAILSSAELFQ